MTFSSPPQATAEDSKWMRVALRLARRGFGATSPNPMVGAVLVRKHQVLGQGWHRRAGEAHAEIEAIRDAQARRRPLKGATLYVTLEPCSTYGRTPPCTDAIVASGVSRVVAAATDPNPKHAGRGFDVLRQGGVEVVSGVRAAEAERLNEAFNHWIVHRTPFVTVKAAMTLDGKIATATGESRWITGVTARAFGMKLRSGADAILVGVNTVLADNPKLTARQGNSPTGKSLRRLVLDAKARSPLRSELVSDGHPELTTMIVSKLAPLRRIRALERRVQVVVAPLRGGRIDLRWLLTRLGAENVTSLLVEGGGEVNASFLLQGLAQRIAFLYAPRIMGGREAPSAVGGPGFGRLTEMLRISAIETRWLGRDLLLTGRVGPPQAGQDSD